jgi:Cysteine rich repeat
MTRLVKLSLLALLLSSSAALAAPGGRGPCAADVQKFCSGVQPGGGRIAACLKEHQADLSPACKEKGAEMKERREERKEARDAIHAACKDDAAKLCGNVQPGGGRIAACLRDNKDKLSDGCKSTIAEERGKLRRQ